MKHRHYDMIVAKAANMDLVVFCQGNGKWVEVTCDFSQIAWWEDNKYFLCLPQHKEACLDWLNGNDVEYRHKDDESWFELSDSHCWCWSRYNNTMNSNLEFRIKPKKEKRWLAYGKGSENVYGSFSNEETCRQYHPDRQIIEIEVEV